MHRCWQDFVPALSVSCFHSFAGALYQAGSLEPEDYCSLWCVIHTPLPDLLFKPALSSQRESKVGIQRLKKVLKNFHTDRVVAAAGSFKGRLWVTHPGYDANPAHPGRRGIMELPLCFWADRLRRAVGVLVKCLGSLYRHHCWDWGDLAVKTLRFLLAQHFFFSPCCTQPCGHHAPSRATSIAHHRFCRGYGWQGMMVREIHSPPPPTELISYMSLYHFPKSIAFSKSSINLFIDCIKKKKKAVENTVISGSIILHIFWVC